MGVIGVDQKFTRLGGRCSITDESDPKDVHEMYRIVVFLESPNACLDLNVPDIWSRDPSWRDVDRQHGVSMYHIPHHLTSCQIYHRLRSSLHPFDTPSSPTVKTGPAEPSSIASQIRSIVLEESRSRYWPHMASASYGVDSELDNVGPGLNVFCRGVESRSNLCHFPAVDDDVVPQSACAMGLPLSQDLLTLFRTRVPTTTCQWSRHS